MFYRDVHNSQNFEYTAQRLRLHYNIPEKNLRYD